MNDPCLQGNKFQPFILSKVSTISVRLTNHVQFTRVAPPSLYEEFLSNKKVLGHNGHFCLLWVSSNCANKLGKCHLKKFQISKNLKWIAEETNSVDHFILKKCDQNVITYHKKIGYMFSVYTKACQNQYCTYIYRSRVHHHISHSNLGHASQYTSCTLTPPHINFLFYFFCVQPVISKNAM